MVHLMKADLSILNYPMAKANFNIVVIYPDEVDDPFDHTPLAQFVENNGLTVNGNEIIFSTGSKAILIKKSQCTQADLDGVNNKHREWGSL